MEFDNCSRRLYHGWKHARSDCQIPRGTVSDNPLYASRLTQYHGWVHVQSHCQQRFSNPKIVSV